MQKGQTKPGMFNSSVETMCKYSFGQIMLITKSECGGLRCGGKSQKQENLALSVGH